MQKRKEKTAMQAIRTGAYFCAVHETALQLREIWGEIDTNVGTVLSRTVV